MYDNNYEEYIRSILGYPYTTNFNANTMYSARYPETNETNMRNDLEDCYPEIYKIIYPMVRKACEGNMRANTREEIERMTDEIYSAIEDNNQINVNINLGNTVSTTNTNRMENRNTVKQDDIQRKISEKQVVENRDIEAQSRRRPTHNNLRDLIKILLIRELLGRPSHNFPSRPPHNPPRPPMRPPIMPRNYQQPLYDIYEY